MNKDYKKILDLIKKYETIIILCHEFPDYDALGTQFGLLTWIQDNFPNKKVYALGEDNKAFTPKLYPETTKDLVLNDKYLCIVVDVANTPRISGKEYLENASSVIKIDHHPKCEETNDDVVIIDDTAAAASELVGDMLVEFNMKMSSMCAYYLYSGLVGDSGRFQYSDTNPRTFKVASELVKVKFDMQDIYDKMYLKPFDEIRVIEYLYKNYKKTKHNVVYYSLSDKEMQDLKIAREEVKAYVNLFAGYEEVRIWVQCTEDITAQDEFKWRVSIRSRGIKINDVASMFNGGGHDNAAGAKVTSLEELDKLVNELDKLLK